MNPLATLSYITLGHLVVGECMHPSIEAHLSQSQKSHQQ